MAKNNPIQDIRVRKEMLRLQIRQQEMEIERSARELAGSFTPNLMKNALVGYVARNPQAAFKVGLVAVNIFSRVFKGVKRTTRKTTKRKTTRKKPEST